MRLVAIRWALVLMATGLALFACGAPEGTSTAAGDEQEPAPDFTVETFGGQPFTLSEQRGTPVVLNFWESW